MENHNAINNFITNTFNKDTIEIDDFGNARFMAIINYSYGNKKINSISKVKIIRNGYQDGKIDIDENDELNINFLHLSFTPNFQDYKYNSNNHSLTINGTSKKLGKYILEILIKNGKKNV